MRRTAPVMVVFCIVALSTNAWAETYGLLAQTTRPSLRWTSGACVPTGDRIAFELCISDAVPGTVYEGMIWMATSSKGREVSSQLIDEGWVPLRLTQVDTGAAIVTWGDYYTEGDAKCIPVTIEAYASNVTVPFWVKLNDLGASPWKGASPKVGCAFGDNTRQIPILIGPIVYGRVTLDLTGNGPTPDDPGLPNWNMYLVAGGAMLANGLTDELGYYAFSVGKPGTYEVSQEWRWGFTPIPWSTTVYAGRRNCEVNFANVLSP